ncbi:MAG TPA: carboxypeptidase-like regulatory domain-containing protein, partial [Terriglobia bacterium]|nr:carboxypeptidase-like regulatory domain-containing protein [Terriglobia bacterium]
MGLRCWSFLLMAAAAWGQTFTGSIRGTITDSTQAAVPSARITATDVDRNVAFTTTTDSVGRYIFPGLPPAQYVLSVEAAGFRKATQPAFRLEVQQQATIDVQLTLGEVTTTVEVEGSAPLLNTTAAALGQVVENRFIMSTPLSTRNPLSLILLAPGIVPTGSGTNFVSSGVRNNASEVLLDGVPLTGIEQNGGVTDVKYTPTVDVIEEFKVQTNFFSAEFGNSGGTVINVVSKSGTNQVHGVGYYFRRDNALNANNWFSNARGGSLPDSTRDNFGGTIGGPVYLPRIYNGKNRTFFFADYDRVKQSSATSQTASVPTAQQLAGDFSDTRLNNGALVPI